MALDRAAEIKKRLSLSSVIRGVVSLKGDGRKFLGLCPFHQEKTPSFNVRDDLGFFKCFGCGASGDIFQFIMLLRGLTFKEAVEELSEKAGLKITIRNAAPKNSTSSMLKGIERANAVAHRFFFEQLRLERGLKAFDYLIKERKLSPAMLDQAKVGFGGLSRDEFFAYLRSNKVSEQEALAAGLVKQGQYSLTAPFLGRIIFPIRQLDGKTIAFGARAFLEADKEQPKYINTHVTELYEKRKCFYGLYESHQAIMKGQPPFLVEGYFDAMALWAAGKPALALCGTAFSNEHAAELKRLSSRVIICFDSDEAGFKAMKSALLPLFKHKLSPSIVSLELKDPGDYLAQQNLASLKSALHDEKDALCHVIDQIPLLSSRDINHRLLGVDELLPVLAVIARPLMQRQYVTYLASKLHEDPAILWMEIKKRQKERVKEEKDTSPKLVLSQEERHLANVFTAFPELLSRLEEPVKKRLSADFINFFSADASQSTNALKLALLELRDSSAELSLDEAKAVIDALHEKYLKADAKKMLQEKRKQLQEAEKLGDFKGVLASLREHSEVLKKEKKTLKVLPKNDSKKEVQNDKEYRPLEKVPPASVEEEDWW